MRENKGQQSSDSTAAVPLHIILPAILVPTILILVCVIFLVNQCYFHRHSEDTCVTCWRKSKKLNSSDFQLALNRTVKLVVIDLFVCGPELNLFTLKLNWFITDFVYGLSHVLCRYRPVY